MAGLREAFMIRFGYKISNIYIYMPNIYAKYICYIAIIVWVRNYVKNWGLRVKFCGVRYQVNRRFDKEYGYEW